MLLTLLWDVLGLREEFCTAWHRASIVLKGISASFAWKLVRGPVTAAWAHLRQVGAEWVSPFGLRLLGFQVDVLRLRPLQVLDVLRAHARRHTDLEIISKIAAKHGEDDMYQATMAEYRHGVDWTVVRDSLLNKSNGLTAIEVRGLRLVNAQAFWAEERRWFAGMVSHGLCTYCMEAIGPLWHRLHGCEGSKLNAFWLQAAGRTQRASVLFQEGSLVPLAVFGLPPRKQGCAPIEGYRSEGSLRRGPRGFYFGGGSGVRKHTRELRRATWALVQQVPEQVQTTSSANAVSTSDEANRHPCPDHFVRGQITG